MIRREPWHRIQQAVSVMLCTQSDTAPPPSSKIFTQIFAWYLAPAGPCAVQQSSSLFHAWACASYIWLLWNRVPRTGNKASSIVHSDLAEHRLKACSDRLGQTID